MKRITNIIWIAAVVGLLALFACSARAQTVVTVTNYVPVTIAPVTNTVTVYVTNGIAPGTTSSTGWLGDLWKELTSGTNDLSGQTNWAVVPYIAYDVQTRKFGYGGAVLYAVTPNFWAGVRAQELEGQQTTAGVQAQLQVSKKVFGITVTPFLETSVGIGKSALYGSAGPGLLVSFHTWVWGPEKQYALTVGMAGDYEHCVNGSRNWNQVNAGPLVRFSF